MGFFQHIKDVMRFMQLPREKRRLTFYSEGKNYWPDLGGMIKEILDTSDVHICYVSSDSEDPGLALKHPNYQTFKIDEGFVRNWFFENLDTDVMVMTMPDLDQYQVKRSKHEVHYIYTQHALGSLHMTYRKGAFDHYDTIFCAGPHHVKEIRAMEEKYSLPIKNIVEHGSARLDMIIEEDKKRIKSNKENKPKHVLLAPTWGTHGTIESGIAEKLIDLLLTQGYKVTLRPHPETIKFSQDKIDAILKKQQKNSKFNYEANISGHDSLHESDVLISDWSGIALDYAFGLNKPVWFVDVPKKINNPDYEELGIEPFEIMVRSKIGVVLDKEDINFSFEEETIDKNLLPFNVGKSHKVGSEYIIGRLTSC